MAKKTISQSKTQYIKKGQKLSDGTVAKKGYVARKGNDLKKVTANVRLAATGDSANSKRLAGKKIGDVVKAQPSRGGGKGGGGSKGGNRNNTSNSTTAPPTDAQKKATRIAKTTVKARTADTQKRKSGTAKTTTTLAQKGSGSNAGASAGARKVSDNSSGQSRVAAGRKTGTTKTGNGKKWYEQGGGGLTGSNSPRLEGFLRPGKNAPKMPKYTSSSKYKWKG